MKPRCLFLVVLVSSIWSCVQGQQFLILALPTASHQQASTAIQLALADTISDPAHLYSYVLWLGSSSGSANLAAVEAYLLANQSITSAFYLLNGIPGEDFIAETAATAQIPVLRHSTPATTGTVTCTANNVLGVDAWSNALSHFMTSFGWNTSILIYQSSAPAADFLTSTAALGLEFPERNLVDSLLPTSYKDAVNSVDRSQLQIVVFLGSSSDLTKFVVALKETVCQLIWIDVNSPVYPSWRDVGSTALKPLVDALSAQVPVTKGFFALAPTFDTANASALLNRLNQSNPAWFGNSATEAALRDNVVPAYELASQWAVAVNQVASSAGDPFDRAEVLAAFSASTAHSFHETTGQKTGPVEILNLQLTERVPVTSSTTSWLRVGSFVGAKSVSGSVTYSVNSSALSFHSGTSAVPYSILPFTYVRIGAFVQLSSPITRYQIATLRYAEERMNAVPLLASYGYRLKLNIEDTISTAQGIITSTTSLLERNVVGFIGPSANAQNQALQQYTGGMKLATVGYGSTSNSLNDRTVYPTYHRVIETETIQARIIAHFVGKYNWTNTCFGTFTTTPALADAYELSLSQLGLDNVKVTRFSFTTSATNFSEVLDVIEHTKCSVVTLPIVHPFMFSQFTPQAVYDTSPPLFGQINLSDLVWLDLRSGRGLLGNPNITWIFTPPASLFAPVNISQYTGVFFVTAVDDPIPSAYQAFVTALANRTTEAYSGLSTYLYDAVDLFTHALSIVAQSGLNPNLASSRDALLSALKSVSFTGLTGQVRLDSIGNRLGGMVGLYNYQPIGTDGRFVQVLAGSYLNGEMSFLIDPIFADGTHNPPREPELPNYDLPYASGAAVLIVLVCIGLVAIVVSTIIVAVHQSNKLIRRSSPCFLVVILVGLAFALVSVFFWLGPPSPALCHLRVWFGFIGASLAYGALLAKNARLYYLFSEPSLRIIAITNRQLLSYLAICLSPLLIVLVLWSSLQPFGVDRQLSANAHETFSICFSGHDKIFAGISFGYMGLLYLIGAGLSWRTRLLPDTFRESWFIALSTYNLLIVTVICVVLGYVLSYDFTASTVITCGGLIIGSLATWALLFIPKFIALVTRRAEIDNFSATGNSPTMQTSKFNSVAKRSQPHSSSKDRSSQKQEMSSTVQPDPNDPSDSSSDSSSHTSQTDGKH